MTVRVPHARRAHLQAVQVRRKGLRRPPARSHARKERVRVQHALHARQR